MSLLRRGIISSGKLDEGDGPFVPTVTPTLRLETDTLVFSDGGTTPAVDNDTIQQWTDFDSNGELCTQTISANRPTYKTNIQNGQPILRFDGVNDWFDITQLFASQQACHFFIVIAPDYAGITFMDFFEFENNLTTWYAATGSSYEDFSLGMNRTVAGMVMRRVVSTSIKSSAWKLLEISYNGGSKTSNSSYTVEVDDVAETIIAGSSSGNAAQVSKLGITAFNGAPYKGDMGDVWMFPQVLTGTDRTEVVNYINTKWGL